MNALKWIVEFFVMFPVNFVKGFIFMGQSLWLMILAIPQMFIDALVFCINSIILAIATVIDWILSLLPLTPFNDVMIGGIDGVELLGYLDWVIPIEYITNTVAIWTTSILLFYGIRILLRWVKGVE